MPKSLGPEGQELYDAVVKYLSSVGNEVEEFENVVLQQACETADRIAQLSAAIDANDKLDVRLLVEERLQRASLAMLITTRLGLPTGLDESDDVGRTPKSRRAQAAASARYRKNRKANSDD
jgi:hypothetical protein